VNLSPKLLYLFITQHYLSNKYMLIEIYIISHFLHSIYLQVTLSPIIPTMSIVEGAVIVMSSGREKNALAR